MAPIPSLGYYRFNKKWNRGKMSAKSSCPGLADPCLILVLEDRLQKAFLRQAGIGTARQPAEPLTGVD